MAKDRKTDIIKNLTPKQQKFVLSMPTAKTATEAVEKSYDTTNRISANALATKLMADTRIRLAVSRMILLEHPDAGKDISSYLMDLINGVYGDAKHTDRLAAVDKVLKIFGEYAPTKSARIKGDLKDWLSLPKDGKE